MQMSLFFADWLVYSGITLVFKFQAVWTTSYHIKKATSVDQISCKLLKAGAPVLNKHLTTLLNNTIKHSQFPKRLKEAQVVPLHKKNDPLDKKKLSSCQYSANNLKIYEVVLSDQLVEILIIFFMIVYVLQKGPCMSDHTTETPWRLEISSGQELLYGSCLDGSFESFWLPAT